MAHIRRPKQLISNHFFFISTLHHIRGEIDSPFGDVSKSGESMQEWPPKKKILSEGNIQTRLEFVNRFREMSVEFWRTPTVFTDESSVG